MSNGTNVRKRSGSIESLDLNKMHKIVDEACKDLAGVSASQVEINSGIQFYDGITTCLLYTSPSPRDKRQSRMPSSA